MTSHLPQMRVSNLKTSPVATPLDSTESFDQQAKNTPFRNRLQCLSFLVSIDGITGMNISVENNRLHLLSLCLCIILYAHVHVCSLRNERHCSRFRNSMSLAC